MNYFSNLWSEIYILPKLIKREHRTGLFSFDLVFDLVFMGALEKLAEIPGN